MKKFIISLCVLPFAFQLLLIVNSVYASTHKNHQLTREQKIVAITILAEARGEGEAGMYAVGACIAQRAFERKQTPTERTKQSHPLVPNLSDSCSWHCPVVLPNLSECISAVKCEQKCNEMLIFKPKRRTVTVLVTLQTPHKARNSSACSPPHRARCSHPPFP